MLPGVFTDNVSTESLGDSLSPPASWREAFISQNFVLTSEHSKMFLCFANRSEAQSSSSASCDIHAEEGAELLATHTVANSRGLPTFVAPDSMQAQQSRERSNLFPTISVDNSVGRVVHLLPLPLRMILRW